MTAKEYLLRYKEASRDVIDTLEELENLRSLITQVKAAQSDSERIKASGNQDPLGDAMVKLIMMENELKSRVEDMKSIIEEIKETISKVKDDDLSRLLYKRYIALKSWEKIAIEMDYSYRWVLRLHGNALKKVEEILKSS